MDSKYYELLSKSKVFRKKDRKIQKLYVECLKILDLFGLPLDLSPRRLERTTSAFLALCNVNSLDKLNKPESLFTPRTLKTREIISWENEHLQESISSGSYDDIRRKDLKLLRLGNVVQQSKPTSATNDSSRGYGINPMYSSVMSVYGEDNWEEKFSYSLEAIPKISDTLQRKRNLKLIPVVLPDGQIIELSFGDHNILQKKVIEDFLPRYGYGSELLYVGDTTDRHLYKNDSRIKELGLPDISKKELPDVIAYSKDRNWIYFIEAVYSSGPISEIRLMQFKKLTESTTIDFVYITAFLDTVTFKKFSHDIAWETEVWIAERPDHMIHFNGDRFIGPY